jgi:hypothetical protein
MFKALSVSFNICLFFVQINGLTFKRIWCIMWNSWVFICWWWCWNWGWITFRIFRQGRRRCWNFSIWTKSVFSRLCRWVLIFVCFLFKSMAYVHLDGWNFLGLGWIHNYLVSPSSLDHGLGRHGHRHEGGRETTIFLEGTGAMCVVCGGGSLSPPLVSE